MSELRHRDSTPAWLHWFGNLGLSLAGIGWLTPVPARARTPRLRPDTRRAERP